MPLKDLVSLIARAFAIYLTILAVWDSTYLAEFFYSTWHYLHESSSLRDHPYWVNYYRLRIVMTCLRIIGAMLAARLFWTAGPAVEKLFAPHGQKAASSELL